MRRVVLTVVQEREIARGRFVRVGPAMQSVLVGKVDGAWKAYLNVCAHRELPLDLGAASPMSDDGEYLLCHQHGALYERADGLCVVGPCVGERLKALEVREGGGGELEVEE
jgi:nitrite reductase/ring-hydroxylating ferredoxin subunit